MSVSFENNCCYAIDEFTPQMEAIHLPFSFYHYIRSDEISGKKPNCQMIETVSQFNDLPSVFAPYLVITNVISAGEELIVHYTGPNAKEFFHKPL